MEQAGAHRGFGCAGDLGGLACGELIDLAEDERDALIVGELVERGVQERRELLAREVVVGAAALGQRLLRELCHRGAAAARGADVLVTAAQRDRDQERAQAGVAAKPADRGGQRDEDVVHEVLGDIVVADQPAREAADRGVVRAVDLVDRLRITAADALFQRRRRGRDLHGIGVTRDGKRDRQQGFVPGAYAIIQTAFA